LHAHFLHHEISYTTLFVRLLVLFQNVTPLVRHQRRYFKPYIKS